MNAVLANLMRKGWKWALIAVVLALIVYRMKFGPVPVSIEPVATGEVVAEVMGTGTLEAHYQATVSAKIQGLIVELLGDQNDWVKRGQLLARLDDSDFKREVTTQEAGTDAAGATVERTIADEARAKALLEQARLDHNRYSGLLGSKSISQEQVDKTSQNLAVAEAELGSRRRLLLLKRVASELAARERLHFQQAPFLADTRITAPFDGFIVRRDREVGDIVVPGASIFLLVSPKEMWISAYVDESAMDRLAPGQLARVIFRSKPQTEYFGKVTRLGQEVDRETREFRVDVGVDTLPTNWGVGQRARSLYRDRAEVWCHKCSFAGTRVEERQGRRIRCKNGRAHWKEITLGLRGSDKVEITRGLSKDEKMITGPDPSQLADGQRVSSQ